MAQVAKYSGMGFQMLATILIGTFIGVEADKYFRLHTPIFTIFGAILSVGIAMYVAVRDLLK